MAVTLTSMRSIVVVTFPTGWKYWPMMTPDGRIDNKVWVDDRKT